MCGNCSQPYHMAVPTLSLNTFRATSYPLGKTQTEESTQVFLQDVSVLLVSSPSIQMIHPSTLIVKFRLMTLPRGGSTTTTWAPHLQPPTSNLQPPTSNTQLQPPTSNLQPLFIDEQLLTLILPRVNVHKASGPDRLRGRGLKVCSTQLSGMLTRLFIHLLDSGCVPDQWRESTIIPIPKKAHAKDLKDYRPVALTSVLCKCMERAVCNLLSSMVSDKLDSHQFASHF